MTGDLFCQKSTSVLIGPVTLRHVVAIDRALNVGVLCWPVAVTPNASLLPQLGDVAACVWTRAGNHRREDMPCGNVVITGRALRNCV